MTTSTDPNVTVDTDLVEMMDGVLAAYRDTHPPVGAVFHDSELWSQLDELGLARLTGSPENGGSGAGWAQRIRHRHRRPVGGIRPACRDHLGGWRGPPRGRP